MQNWGKFFTCMVVIGSKIFSNYPQNMNHVHKDSKDLVPVIITQGENISGGALCFMMDLKHLTSEVDLMP